MCDTCQLDTVKFEALDTGDTENAALEALVLGALEAHNSQTCCLQRKNAMHRYVVETAAELGYHVAWGYTLRAEGEPDYYIWRMDSWRTSMIADWLERNRATQFYPRDISPVAP